MTFDSITYRDGPTGARLATRMQPAAGPARGSVLISHGLAEHSGRYGRFADLLSARGYHVHGLDHRGHGRTSAADAPLGRFATRDGIEAVIADLMAVRADAEAFAPGLPIILFGHSMGGLIAANAASRHPHAFAGLAIWNSNLDPGLAGHAGRLLVKAERFFKGSDVPSRLAPKLTFEAWGKAVPGHVTPFDWLSHDGAEVAAYIADPLCGFDASVSLWIDVLTLAIEGGSPAQLARLPKALPVHLVGGSQDPATEQARAMTRLKARLDGLGMADVSLTIHEGMRHETLNEIGWRQAADGFADWCDRITTPRP